MRRQQHLRGVFLIIFIVKCEVIFFVLIRALVFRQGAGLVVIIVDIVFGNGEFLGNARYSPSSPCIRRS